MTILINQGCVENRHLGRAFHQTLARVEEERSGGVEEERTLDDAYIVA
jgi:hypothetical protein